MQAVEHGIDSEKIRQIPTPPLVGFFQPGKRLIAISKAGIDSCYFQVRWRSRRRLRFQRGDDGLRLVSFPCYVIGVTQQSTVTRLSSLEGDSSLKLWYVLAKHAFV